MSELVVMKEQNLRFKIKYVAILLVMAVMLLLPIKGHAEALETYDFDRQAITFTVYAGTGSGSGTGSGTGSEPSTNEGGLPATGENTQFRLIGLGAVLILVSIGVVKRREEVER